MNNPYCNYDLGILGGMGPRATNYFTNEVIESISKNCKPIKDQDYPNLLIKYACYLPDRTLALMNNEVDNFLDLLINELELFSQMGCSQIVIPCISAYMVTQNQIKNDLLLNIPLFLSNYLKSFENKTKIGMLSTRGSRLSGIIDYLSTEKSIIEPLKVDEEEKLMSLVYGQIKSWENKVDVSCISELTNGLFNRGCEFIITGCTEVEMIISQLFTDDCRFIFPLKLIANDYSYNWKLRMAK